MCKFRSSTPILNRVNEEQTKVPTIDLFDMLNTSDYREEKYVLYLYIKCSVYGSLLLLYFFLYRCNDKEYKQFYSEKKNDIFEQSNSPGFWITVFGFSISNKDEILAKFTQMASCCDVRQAGPNWVHICFSDSTDYHRALLFNGHVTNNGAMIGVITCNDKVISRIF